MSDKQHTPTPYCVSERTADDTVDWANILGPNNTFIAMCGSRNALDSPGRANADFIVHCVNLHDELVAACKRSLNTYSPNECDCALYDEGKICPACELRAVLAKCETKKQGT